MLGKNLVRKKGANIDWKLGLLLIVILMFIVIFIAIVIVIISILTWLYAEENNLVRKKGADIDWKLCLLLILLNVAAQPWPGEVWIKTWS